MRPPIARVLGLPEMDPNAVARVARFNNSTSINAFKNALLVYILARWLAKVAHEVGLHGPFGALRRTVAAVFSVSWNFPSGKSSKLTEIQPDSD